MPRIETHKKLNHNKNRTMLLNEEKKNVLESKRSIETKIKKEL